MIPDIGGPPNNYFVVRDRDNWRQAFSAWLQTPLDINEEISDYDSETDGSAHADNLTSSSNRLQRVPSKRSHTAFNLCVAFLLCGILHAKSEV